MTGLEFLSFQTGFLPNKERYPYWPFVISFNFQEHLSQIDQLYACNQLVDIAVTSLTSDKSYDEIFEIIQRIKPKQNKLEGLVFKSLTKINLMHKLVFPHFRMAKNHGLSQAKKVFKVKIPLELNEKEIEILDACTLDYMINCLSKAPWRNVESFYSDLLQDLEEDGYNTLDVDAKKLKGEIIKKIMRHINIKNGSLK